MAAVLRFAFLDQQSFWFDEAVTVHLVRKSLPDMLAAIPDTESTPPLYYVVAWGWSRIFGTGEVGLRSLSAALGTATVPVAFAVGRLFVSRRAGVFGAALVACSPFLVWYSQEARSYAALAFLSLLSVLAFGHAMRRPTKSALTWWAVTASLALATHYFAVFLIGAEAGWLLITCLRRRRTAVAVAATAATGALLLPLAFDQENTGRTWWVGARPLRGRIVETLTQFTTGAYTPPHHAAAVIALIALGLAAGGLLWLAEQRERRGVAMLLVLSGVAVVAALALGLAATRLDKFYYRNLIGVWPVLAIALAAVLATRRAGRVGVGLVTVACALELGSLALVLHRPALQRDDWRSATKALGPSDEPRAIMISPSWERDAIQLYLPNAGAMPAAGARVRQIVFLGLARLLPLDFRPPAGFKRIEQRTIQHVALVRYRASEPQIVTPEQLEERTGFDVTAVVESSPAR